VSTFAKSAFDANLSQQSRELGQALSNMNAIDLTIFTTDLKGNRLPNPDIPVVAGLINTENFPYSSSINKVRAKLVYQIEDIAMVLKENIDVMKNCEKFKDQARVSSVREDAFGQHADLHFRIQSLSEFDQSVKAAFKQGQIQSKNSVGACASTSDSSAKRIVPKNSVDAVTKVNAILKAE